MKRLFSIAIAFLALAAPALAQTDKPAEAPKQAAPKVYDETIDARQQIADALAAAKKDNKRVLIQWGGNWCPWCIRMHQLMTTNKRISHTILNEYEYIHVDCGRPNGKNVDLAKSCGAEIKRFPFLTILDADGKPLLNQDTVALEINGDDLAAGHDPAKLLAILDDHITDRIAAQSVLDKGLARAKSADKTVFLHFGAPYCIWCKRLEKWMARPDVLAILDRAFVDVKIDTERNTGGQDMLDAMSNKKSDGIPWIAFLDATGKPIIDSMADGKNIGFPSEDAEYAHFEAMLKKGARHLSAEDIKTLMASLKAEKPTPAPKPGSN